MWSLLLKGTTARSSKQLAEDIESIGAHIGAMATQDYSQVSCHSISDYFTEALRMMSEVLFHPAYVPTEVEKERAVLLAAIQAKKENIFTVASEELNRHLYGDHPYAQPTSGTDETASKLNPGDLHRWHDHVVIPKGGVLSITTNLTFKPLMKELNNLFGPALWPDTQARKKLPSKTPDYPKTSVSIERKDPFEQAFLMEAFPAPNVKSKDFVTLKVLTTLLGGGMSSRLFQALREKEGLAYDVGAFFPSRKDGSAFVVYLGLQAARMEQAKKRIRELLSDIQSEKVSETELAQVKSYIKGSFILDNQTNSQRSYYLGWWHVLGLDASYGQVYLKKIGDVSVKDIQRAAKKYFSHPSVTVEIQPK